MPWAVGLAVPPVLLALALAAACLAAGLSGAGASTPLRRSLVLVGQSRRVTVAPDALLWRIGTASPLVLAALLLAMVPFGRWLLADPPVGIVWVNTFDVWLWAAWWLAGWGANALHPLVGGYRLLGQALSYELPLMFALTAPAVAAGSLRVGDVVGAQQHGWYVLQMPLALLVYLVAVVGYASWGPLSSAVGRDLQGGVLAELSGLDRLLVLAGRYALLVAGCAVAVALFLGGGAGPLLPAVVWSLLKTALLVVVVLVVSRRLPTVRPERFAPFAWLVLLPLSLLQVLITSLVAVSRG
jgi:NADH-quinone oxidoreductase subunit H